MAITAVFALNGALFASMFSRLPAIQERAGIGAGVLGLALTFRCSGCSQPGGRRRPGDALRQAALVLRGARSADRWPWSPSRSSESFAGAGRRPGDGRPGQRPARRGDERPRLDRRAAAAPADVLRPRTRLSRSARSAARPWAAWWPGGRRGPPHLLACLGRSWRSLATALLLPAGADAAPGGPLRPVPRALVAVGAFAFCRSWRRGRERLGAVYLDGELGTTARLAATGSRRLLAHDGDRPAGGRPARRGLRQAAPARAGAAVGAMGMSTRPQLRPAAAGARRLRHGGAATPMLRAAGRPPRGLAPLVLRCRSPCVPRRQRARAPGPRGWPSGIASAAGGLLFASSSPGRR